MYAKVFKRGAGKSGGIDYLLSERDAGKNPRSILAKVLRGDPELTKALIDAADFNQRYTSGVLSFAEKDLPDKIKQAIIDSAGSRYFCESLFWASQPKQAAKT